MIDTATAIRREHNGKNWEYVFSCEDCGAEIRRRLDRLKKLSTPGCCLVCGNKRNWSQKLKPFESLFRLMRARAKNRRPFNLTFEEFLRFTKTSSCTYCDAAVVWRPRQTYLGESRAYNLDCKVPALGYSKKNCVVCCWECNRIKGTKYTFNQMKVLGKALKRLRKLVL